MRLTAMILLSFVTLGTAVNSFGMEYQTAKAYMALNGQVSDAGEKAPSPVRSRR